MSQLTFDTLEFVRTLEKAGIPKAHAEAITAAQKQAFGDMVAAKDFATKGDILALKQELKQDMVELEARLDVKMANLKADLTKWFMGTILTILGFMFAGFGIIISRLP